MLKKVFAVFPVFIFFAFSGLVVFASPSSPIVFSSGSSASTNLPAEKIAKIDQLWSGIKNEIKKWKLYFLTKIPINIPTQGGKLYDLGPLYKAAQNENELAASGSSLTTEGAREKLLELVNDGLDSAKVNPVLLYEQSSGSHYVLLRKLWNDNFIQELSKPKYAHLIRVPITIKGSSYDFEPFFRLVARHREDGTPWYALTTAVKDLLVELAKAKVSEQDPIPALAKTALDLLWSEIKSELKTLSKTSIKIDGKDYDLTPLLNAAKDDVEYAKKGSELPAQAKNKLQELVNDVVVPQKFKDASAKTALDLLWSEIKSELKTKYSHLSKTLIKIDGKDYDLAPLLTAAKDDVEYAKKGSELPAQAKNKLQELVNDVVIPQKFKDASAKTALDLLWSEIKSELKTKYSHLSKTPIKIDGKDYDLAPLLTAAKDDVEYAKKGPELSAQAKNKLQELVNDVVIPQKFKDASAKTALDFLWSEIKSELKTKYSHLSKTPIKIDGKDYDLAPLLTAAKDDVEYAKKGSELSAQAKDKLQELVNDVVIPQKFKDASAKTALDFLWSEIKSELKTKYSHLSKTPIKIDGKDYDLAPLLTAAKDDVEYAKKGPELSAQAKNKLQELVNDVVIPQKFKDASAKTALDLLWSEIKSELKTKYSHLSKTPIKIDGKDYDLAPLLTAAKDDVEYAKKGSELPAQAKNKLQELVNDVVVPQKFKDASAKTALDLLWSEIKSELKKPDYASLVKTPILINGDNYNLEPLLTAAKNDVQYEKKGSELPAPAKNKLQSLVSADVQHQIFKTSLVTINNQKLDNLWTQLKKILNQPEFSKWKDTSIKIKNKIYDLKLLFDAAKEKGDVKGSALPLDVKLQLQELVNDQVTFKMIENQLPALNQAEAEKNKQAKEKQQSQDLTIGLATGGVVLVAAGLGGFLYWFFRIRK